MAAELLLNKSSGSSSHFVPCATSHRKCGRRVPLFHDIEFHVDDDFCGPYRLRIFGDYSK